ncbi:leucine-rich repeat domain-containing protein [Bifidobacterium sp. ESL0798]|uniref:leucine-rich repeat domain-containing protein n=1 Tax=Bifidobacterium sp. ESL0798 TaxID=2983235 RepID=UPI0023F85791|nr:leucine-rich repeat domain-containing protein [Bifidobacterium sp. ESL0798]WEV74040.1 leucine-rich repeat domain-containing protein [Bifidobacterium sp. ESL0798]
MRTWMRIWLWIVMGALLLALCFGVFISVFRPKAAFDGYAGAAAAGDASSVLFSPKSKGIFGTDSLATYIRRSGVPAPRTRTRTRTRNHTPFGDVSLKGHVVNGTGFNPDYLLTYDTNGGTEASPTGAKATREVATCPSQHIPGEMVTLPTSAADDCRSSDPTRDGMEFVGWSTVKLPPFDSLSEAQAHVVDMLTMPKDAQTVYAVWVRDGETPTSYTVTFKTQMNSAGIAAEVPALTTVTVTPGATLPASSIPSPPASYNPGIKFMGWGVPADGIGNGEGKMTWFDESAPITANETVWTLWGYEDTAAGHKCVLGIDTVATCFPDPTLAQKVASSPPPLVGGAQPANIVHNVTDVWSLSAALSFGSLNYNSGNETEDTPLRVSELDGLQTLTGLGQLHISNVDGHTLNAHSRDLHQLKYLDKMNDFFANGDGITDVSALSGLSSLQTLYLDDNNVSDVSALSGLSSLQTLNLNHNNVSNLAGLSGLTKLQTLNLDDNARGSTIPDLSSLISSPTVGLTSLQWLSLNNDKLGDVSALAHLTALNKLQLQHNRIRSIDSWTSFTGIYALYLDNNQISDISVINHANFQWLGVLGLSNNQVSDVSSLRDMTTLTKLWLHYNKISDVSPLAGLTNLTMLYIGSNNILDISPLKNLAGLSGGTSNSCNVGNSSFCADNQSVTLPEGIADPGLSMSTAVTLKKAADGSIAGASVDSTSIHSTTPGARFDAEHRQLTWDGPMQYNNDDSTKDLTQTFDSDAQLPNTIGNFSGTITEPYKVAWHTVTFDPGAGTLPSGQPSSVQVHSGYKIAAPTAAPTRAGYRFAGWYVQVNPSGSGVGSTFDFTNTPVTKGATLHAGWIAMAAALPFTGASYRSDLWRTGLAVIAFGLVLVSGSMKRRVSQR